MVNGQLMVDGFNEFNDDDFNGNDVDKWVIKLVDGY